VDYFQHINENQKQNLNLQKIATEVLREGLINYDQRKGWRGPLTNKKNLQNWNKDKSLEKFKLEKSINWELAIIKKINQFLIEIETEKKLKGKINYENISWTKKEFKELIKVGDIIYVKKLKNNIYFFGC